MELGRVELRHHANAAIGGVLHDPAPEPDLLVDGHALDHLVVLVGLDSTPGSDRHTLQLLGIRELNFVSSALKVGMSGYYQVAFALLRDLLETTNLVDLFLSDPKLVSVWKDGDKKTQDRLFKPVAVRMALETRYAAPPTAIR